MSQNRRTESLPMARQQQGRVDTRVDTRGMGSSKDFPSGKGSDVGRKPSTDSGRGLYNDKWSGVSGGNGRETKGESKSSVSQSRMGDQSRDDVDDTDFVDDDDTHNEYRDDRKRSPQSQTDYKHRDRPRDRHQTQSQGDERRIQDNQQVNSHIGDKQETVPVYKLVQFAMIIIIALVVLFGGSHYIERGQAIMRNCPDIGEICNDVIQVANKHKVALPPGQIAYQATKSPKPTKSTRR